MNGWVSRVPGESYQKKFSDKVKKIGDFILNRRRPDSGTKGNIGGLHHEGKDRVTKFKNANEKIFVQEDLADLNKGNQPEQDEFEFNELQEYDWNK